MRGYIWFVFLCHSYFYQHSIFCFIHSVANNKISLFYGWMLFSCMYQPHFCFPVIWLWTPWLTLHLPLGNTATTSPQTHTIKNDRVKMWRCLRLRNFSMAVSTVITDQQQSTMILSEPQNLLVLLCEHLFMHLQPLSRGYYYYLQYLQLKFRKIN